MIFSLRGIMGSPARTARLRLVAGKADPSNPMSKFLMVLCKQPRGCEVVSVEKEVGAGSCNSNKSSRVLGQEKARCSGSFRACSLQVAPRMRTGMGVQERSEESGFEGQRFGRYGGIDVCELDRGSRQVHTLI